MPVVLVNKLTVVHKDSSGIAAAFPDPCKTPTPAGPVPIPYPNIAQSSDTGDGSSTVTVGGNPIMLESSNFATSTGDEAGSAQGVASNKIKGKAVPQMYSMDVKVDGKAVFRFSDIMVQNQGSPPNTPPAAEVQAPNAAADKSNDPEKSEVTELAWAKETGACGDQIKFKVKAKTPDKPALAVLVRRTDLPDETLEILHVQLTADEVVTPWLARRGPAAKSAKLKLHQNLLGGTAVSSNELELRAPEHAKETVSGTRSPPQMILDKATQTWKSNGNYSIPYAYDIELRPGELRVTHKVNFTFPDGASPSAQALKTWAQEIRSVWDRKFKLHRVACRRKKGCDCSAGDGCCKWVIRVLCEFGPGHQPAVKLHKGSNKANDWGGPGWWYQTDWWEASAGVPPTVRGHEFGHLLGFYDEYVTATKAGASVSGANDPQYWKVPKAALDKLLAQGAKNVMGGGAVAARHHFLEFQQWFNSKASAKIGSSGLFPL